MRGPYHGYKKKFLDSVRTKSALLRSLMIFLISASQDINYYWRDYTGDIPKDAVPGGTDANGDTTYIGQGFVIDIGLIPGVIYPSQKYITVPTFGVRKVDTYIKVSRTINFP